MSEAYERARGGRLAFKGGELAIREKAIGKNKKKKNKNKTKLQDDAVPSEDPSISVVEESGADVYTIDAAKKMKYDELFPVETKKFGYDPTAKKKSVEEALDDRVKKKADRYCK